jgi:hypothetical protein
VGVAKGIWVTGLGSASGLRDECRISAGVEVRRSSAGAALTESAAALEAMRQVALAAGLNPADLTTSQVSLSPVYDQYPVVSGFTAALSLVVRTRDIATAGRLLGQLVAVAGDEARLHGVSFSHSDPSQLMRQARDAAWADALARATQLAALAGRELGDVLAVTEAVGQVVPRPRGGPMMAMASAPEVPLDGGEGEVNVSLTVGWALR